MTNIIKLKNGNITLLAIVVSAIIIGFGVTVTSVLTNAIISVSNISKSNVAYYEAEAGAENGYYIFAGHLAGFQYNYDNDSTCEIENGEDKWCLKGRLNSVPETEDRTTYETLSDNGVVSIGLYNDISLNPFGITSTSTANVAISTNQLTILLAPANGSLGTSNNQVGSGDMRITSVTAGSDTYEERTQVETGNLDIGNQLLSNLTSNTCINQKYTATGQDLIWDNGEFLYRDIDESKTVTIGDIRMIATGSYGPGTTVTTGDSDIGLTLNSGIINIGCAQTNLNYVYATDIAQIVISGQDDSGNKSLIHVISKNQLSGMSATTPLSFTKDTLINNVNYLAPAPSCSCQDFLTTGNADCANSGAMKEPQLQIYAFSEALDYRIDGTFSDFSIYNSNDNMLARVIDIAGTNGTSTLYHYMQSSSSTIGAISASGTFALSIQEYGTSGGYISTSNIVVTDGMTGNALALEIQNALNNTTNLANEYSVSFRDSRFQIISTGITLTNPQTTLISKGTKDSFQQSIQTSITDSSLVPIFGWYSVF